tara:strand:- start:19740 stop:19910 length:171 start_codon:yes stop_codon:yes gene_type:complete
MTIDPARFYLVKLAHVVELDAMPRFRPLAEFRMKGATVQKVLDKYGEAALERCDSE